MLPTIHKMLNPDEWTMPIDKDDHGNGEDNHVNDDDNDLAND
jgi:hypothetical protein